MAQALQGSDQGPPRIRGSGADVFIMASLSRAAPELTAPDPTT